MRKALWIGMYVFGVFLAGVVISPVAYWVCQWMAAQGWFEELARFPFYRFFNRTVQVAAIVLLVPLVWALGMRRLADFGLGKNGNWWRDFLAGVVVAIVPLSVFFGWGLWSGGLVFRGEVDWRNFGEVILRALGVAAIEEVVFRGVLLGILVRAMGGWMGGVVASAIFAFVHFLKPAGGGSGERVTWISGWEQMVRIWDGIPEMPLLAWGVGTLFAIGLMLAQATRKTRSLWLAVGLHAGWIFGQQGTNLFFRWRVIEDGGWLWLGPTMVSGMVPTGIVPLLVIGVSWILLWVWLARR